MQRLGVVLNQVARPTVEIVEGGCIRVDAQRVIQRGVHLGEGYRPVAGLAAEAVGRTYDLSVIESTAGEQAARDARPMVAAGVFVDGRCAAELTPANDDDILVQSALVQIVDERSDTLVEHGEILPGAVEVSAVPVPPAEGERHTAHTHLDEAAGEQEVIEQLGRAVGCQLGGATAVTVAQFHVFLPDVERLGEFAGCEHSKRLLVVGVHALDQAGVVDVAPELVEALQELAAVIQPLEGDAV